MRRGSLEAGNGHTKKEIQVRVGRNKGGKTEAFITKAYHETIVP